MKPVPVVHWNKVGARQMVGRLRQLGLDADGVDYKVCSVEQTWSGLRFARREV